MDSTGSSPPPAPRRGPRARSGSSAATSPLDARICAALTDLHAYVHALDAQADRMNDRIGGLPESAMPGGELTALTAERSALAAEAGLLRSAIDGLRRLADPAGRYL